MYPFECLWPPIWANSPDMILPPGFTAARRGQGPNHMTADHGPADHLAQPSAYRLAIQPPTRHHRRATSYAPRSSISSIVFRPCTRPTRPITPLASIYSTWRMWEAMRKYSLCRDQRKLNTHCIQVSKLAISYSVSVD